jgi:membrane protease YdiL (CAAX protease family)
VAPAAEEVYFRGYLLPRLSRFGYAAALVHTLLFALYHTWTPWLAVSRIIGVLPLALVTIWKRNLYIALWAHILGNTVDVIVAALYIARHL